MENTRGTRITDDRQALASRAPVNLTVSILRTPLTEALFDSRATPSGVTFHISQAESVDRNSRRMLDLDFDVAEMSLATYVKAREQQLPLIGLPVFTGRRFLHPCILCSSGANIQSPSDLRRKRVGLPQFWLTSSVWHRGILQQQYGVEQEAVTWYTAGEERMGSLRIPENVWVRALPAGTNLTDMLLRGDLDATMTPRPGDTLAKQDSRVMQPFSDVVGAQRDYYRSTQVFPIMHFVVMRQERLDAHPWLAESLCVAFREAKHLAVQSGSLDAPIARMPPQEVTRVFGSDPWPFGLVDSNLRPLETFLQFAETQGLVATRPPVEELFAPSTHQFFA